MGSIASEVGDEYHPSISISKRNKCSEKFHDDCSIVDHVLVPRKLRSAIKKRGRESIMPPLPISRKLHSLSNGAEGLSKDSSKKPKQHMALITKDEEEVAETLYALAAMIPGAKTDKPGQQVESSEVKFVGLQEAEASKIASDGAAMAVKESRAVGTTVTHHSKVAGSPEQFAKFQYPFDTQQPEFPFSKQPLTASASGVQSELNLQPRGTQSKHDVNGSRDRSITLEQVAAIEIKTGSHHITKDTTNNGLFMFSGCSAAEAPNSETEKPLTESITPRLPAWLENTKAGTQPGASENIVSPGKGTEASAESKKSWKRCSFHVYICRLIKVLQVTEKNDGLHEMPMQSTSSGCLKLGLHVGAENHRGENGFNGVVPDNIKHSSAVQNAAETQHATFWHKTLLQDQHQASTSLERCTSQKQGTRFLSLATVACDLDTNGGINRVDHGCDTLKRFHTPDSQSQNYPLLHLSMPQKGYSSSSYGHPSAAAAQQVQLPPYISSTLTIPPQIGATNPVRQQQQQQQQQQQKWASPLQAQFNPSGLGTPHLADWQNGMRDSPLLLNYAQALFPHLHSTLEVLGSKYPAVAPERKQLMNSTSSLSTPSNIRTEYHHFPMGYERNTASLHPDNGPKLQLLCKQHL